MMPTSCCVLSNSRWRSSSALRPVPPPGAPALPAEAGPASPGLLEDAPPGAPGSPFLLPGLPCAAAAAFLPPTTPEGPVLLGCPGARGGCCPCLCSLICPAES